MRWMFIIPQQKADLEIRSVLVLLTSDGVEGWFGSLLETVSELQHVLLFIQRRVRAPVHHIQSRTAEPHR